MITPDLVDRLRRRLRGLDGPRAETTCSGLLAVAERHLPQLGRRAPRRWDQRDVVLIVYGDQVSSPGRSPLATLHDVLVSAGLDSLVSTLHLLPFYPHSSDDGFSVIDYRAVDAALGDWDDIERLGRRFELMFDLVLNHASRHSRWFQEYLAGREPYCRWFLEVAPDADLSLVPRPRVSPLATEVMTARGPRRVWTTFSADQIDLNYANPEVLVEMADVLLSYVARGARIVRLDAVAYLWKQPGTPCIHLPQTHEVVKLLRDLLEGLAPDVLLLTETNVPHAENVRYLGEGDEAHMVYQFSLPPLLLDAYLLADTGPLADWLDGLPAPPSGTTYFNFTASHDGIGLRPLEDLVPETRREALIEAVRRRGGLVSCGRRPDGSESPYELNVSYLDALGEPGGLAPKLHARRFLGAQAVALALRGMPAVYFPSLFGIPGDSEAALASGQWRRINRRKLQEHELRRMLEEGDGLAALVFSGYRRLLAARRRQPAFHPDAAQTLLPTGSTKTLALLRTSLDGRQTILVAANVDGARQSVELPGAWRGRMVRDLVEGRPCPPAGRRLDLEPYQTVWVELAPGD